MIKMRGTEPCRGRRKTKHELHIMLNGEKPTEQCFSVFCQTMEPPVRNFSISTNPNNSKVDHLETRHGEFVYEKIRSEVLSYQQPIMTIKSTISGYTNPMHSHTKSRSLGKASRRPFTQDNFFATFRSRNTEISNKRNDFERTIYNKLSETQHLKMEASRHLLFMRPSMQRNSCTLPSRSKTFTFGFKGLFTGPAGGRGRLTSANLRPRIQSRKESLCQRYMLVVKGLGKTERKEEFGINGIMDNKQKIGEGRRIMEQIIRKRRGNNEKETSRRCEIDRDSLLRTTKLRTKYML